LCWRHEKGVCQSHGWFYNSTAIQVFEKELLAMALNPTRASARPSYFTLISLFSFLLLSSCLAAFAQGGVGSTRGLPSSAGGVHSIQGRLYFPPGQAVKQLRVRLEGNITGGNSTLSSADGSFIFTSLPAGTYSVVIEADPDYEPFRESVTIYGTSAFESRVAPQTVNVQVNLRLKGSGPDPATAAALEKVPVKARELYSKGMEAAAKGDSKRAVEHLNGAVSAYPEFHMALSELGVQYLKLGQADKAGESLQAALKLAPDAAGVRLNYGFALLSQKKFAEAETQLREVLKKNNAMPTAHMYLGIVLISVSRDEKTKQFNVAKYEEAQKEFETAVTTGKTEVAQAHRYLGGIYWGNKDYKRAADEFEIYLKLTPKAPDAEKIRAAIKDLRSKQ
jgi:tetratricopeptide (TPR) repeat protein